MLAYQISRNWNGHINLITVVGDENEKSNGEKFFRDMITWGRMPRGTKGIVYVGTFDAALSGAPKADLSIFGLHNNIDIDFMFRVMQQARSSCIFVRDSGYESALA